MFGNGTSFFVGFYKYTHAVLVKLTKIHAVPLGKPWGISVAEKPILWYTISKYFLEIKKENPYAQ